MNPVERLLRDLVAALDRHGIPYAVMGGFAVRALGLPRPTYDVDVTVTLDREALPTLFDTLDDLGYDVADQYRGGWVDQVAEMPLVKASTFADGRSVVADIFLAESAFQKSLMERRFKDRVDDFEVWLVSPEDLILLKLVASRHRDLSDVQDILLVQGQLDDAYLDSWAERLEITDRLKQARKEFGS